MNTPEYSSSTELDTLRNHFDTFKRKFDLDLLSALPNKDGMATTIWVEIPNNDSKIIAKITYGRYEFWASRQDAITVIIQLNDAGTPEIVIQSASIDFPQDARQELISCISEHLESSC